MQKVNVRIPVVAGKIEIHLQKFNNAENKIEALYYLKEILFLLEKEKGEKILAFFDLIKKEFHFEVGKTNWKKALINCPEIGFSGNVNACLFQKKELENKKVYAPDNSLVSIWDYINKKVVYIFDKYQNIYFQLVEQY